jgi:hypothetical protein
MTTTSEQLQLRSGTQSQIAAFTGAQAEVAVDTTNNRVVVQDGSTAGGWPAARLSEIGGGYLNKFRNGAMDVWQRGTSLSVATSGAYTADGWIVLPAAASVTATQAGGRLLSKCSLQVTGAASVTDVIVKQRLESLIATAFCSQTVTVQAQVYNNTGGAITPKLTVNHAGAQDNWSSAVTDVNAVSLQACANGAWTLIAYTFQANANAFNGLEIIFDFGNNFSTASKSVQIAECDIRVTNGMPAGLTANPPPPELRAVSTEMVFCFRYYWRWAPSVADLPINILAAFSSTGAWGKLFDLPTEMRAAPSCNVSSASHFAFSNPGGSARSVTATDFTNSTAQTIATWNGWTASTATMTANQAIMLYGNTSSAWIDASAEL